MGSTIRFPSKNEVGSGLFWKRFEGLPVGNGSTVTASICEISFNDPGAVPITTDTILTVHNIVPRDGGTVDARIQIQSPDPTNYRVNFLISNDAG
jgi:hypothetical protein